MAEKKETKEKFYRTVGRRKRATATVHLFKGKGKITVDGKPVEEVFPSELERTAYLEPFTVTETEGEFDATVQVSGGGKKGQLGAMIHGFARALVEVNEKNRTLLRAAGLLTRDPREKERKKYFLRKARKRPQYSKR